MSTTIYLEIEKEYSASTSMEHRKKFAQFFTPQAIADLMSKWLLGHHDLKRVLEPAFGLGVFARSLLIHKADLLVKGFDVDPNIYSVAKKCFEERNVNVSIVLQDYIYSDWDNKYDGIICNPPYFKFHDYDNKGLLKEIEARIGYKLSGLTNLYTLFLLKSLHQLGEGGRLAYIVPSEFLNSDYGKLVKAYLVKSKALRHIVVVNFEESVFDDALTTACILLCANDGASTNVQFSNLVNLDDLTKVESLIALYPQNNPTSLTYEFENLNPEIKWRGYYQDQNAIKYQHLVPFSKYGKVVRGIATGANEYFTFNRSKAIEFGIEDQFLLPCICKAADARKAFFTREDFEQLQVNDRSVFLLNALNPNDNVMRYLDLGVKEEVNKKFLTKNRRPWYTLENRPPAPIWVSVFNRNGVRFIKNEANISNLTTFHCIYPTVHSEGISDLLFAYLLTGVSRQIFDDNRREYGNGLQKFEPNDINKALMLDLAHLHPEEEARILEYYGLYRQSVIVNRPNESLLNEIENIFLEHYSA